MKCDYCEAEDHLMSACTKRKGERTFLVAGGCIGMALLAPFFILGLVAGAVSSAFMEGFKSTMDFWQVVLRRIREKRDEEPQIRD